MKLINSFFLMAVYCLVPSIRAQDGEFPKFESHTIDAHAGEICYGVCAADVDSDRRLDAVVVTERSVLWYRSPNWEKNIVVEDVTPRDNVCIAAHDIDRDEHIDFALGAGWPNGNGEIFWLRRGSDVYEPWQAIQIGSEPSLHRIRFADVLKTGTPQLVISPLNKTAASGVRLMTLTIPQDPETDRWAPTILDQSLNKMHNHWHVDLDGDGTVETLTASLEGLHLVFQSKGQWQTQLLAAGNESDAPDQRGSGEVKTVIGKDGRKLLTSIEPMHGNQVIVYTPAHRKDGLPAWNRHVIADGFRRGHALWCANLDGDPEDEIIAGYSDPSDGPIKGPGLFLFDSVDSTGQQWQMHELDDGGIATEDAVAADFDQDGDIDILACGRATRNVKLYINQGTEAKQK